MDRKRSNEGKQMGEKWKANEEQQGENEAKLKCV